MSEPESTQRRVPRAGGSYSPGSANVADAVRGYRKFGGHTKRYEFAKSLCTGLRTLDYGCGHGLGRVLLGDAPISYVGIDTDQSALSWASSQIVPIYGDSTRFIGEAELDSRDVRYDVVIAFEVIEHVEDPIELLLRLRGALAARGRLILSTPNGRFFDAKHANPFHVKEYLFSEVDRMLVSSGLLPTYFKERRRDRLDVLAMKFNLRVPVETTLLVDGTAIRSGVGRLGDVYHDKLNGDAFWEIRRSTAREMRIDDYSTLIAICEASDGPER